MRLMWVSHFLLYPETGYGALQRSRNLLKALCKFHDVILVCLVRESDTKLVEDLDSAEKDLRRYCKEIVFLHHSPNRTRKASFLFHSILRSVPYSVSIYRSHALMQEILRMAESFRIDAIHVDTIGLAESVLHRIDSVKILNHHDIESHKMSRRCRNEKNFLKSMFFRHEARCLEAYEKEYCRMYDLNIVVSEVDGKRLQDTAGRIPMIVVENGVDCEYFRFHPRTASSRELIFTGAMDYYPNLRAVQYFCDEIWPELKRQHPDLKFTVIGKNPDNSIRSMGHTHSGVHILGYVEDVRPFIERARIFVCPILEGGGTRIKILDAFSQGIPVVSTEIGAEGLHLENGKNILIANTKADFIRAVSILLDDIGLCDRISRNARDFVEKTYSYEWIGEKMASAYQDLLDQHT